MKKIIIKCFKTLKNYYFYDRYTNSVVKVSPEEYEVLVRIEKEGCLSEGETCINKFLELGFLHESIVSEIKHPATDDLEYYSKNKVQQLILQVTQQCNLRCSYCTYSGNYYNRGHSDKKMTFDVAKKVIDFYFDHSSEKDSITIAFYGGEPLLEFPLIKKCVEYSEAKTKDKEIYFYITTNGTLLTEQIISYLCEHNFNITISLDGDKEEHNKNRRFLEGTGSFDLIMNNLQKIKDYDEIFFNKVRYNAVVSPKSDWNKVFKFFSESSLIDPHNVKLNPVADDCLVNKSLIEADENFWIPYRYEYMKLLLYMIGELKFNDIHPSFEKSMFEIKRLYKMLQQHNCEQPKMHHSGPCLPGIQRLFVDTVGRFYPCERVSENIPDMNMGSVEKGYNYEKMRVLLNIGELTQENCLNCWNLRHCKICAGQIEPIDNKLTCQNKLLICPKSENEVLGRIKDLCVLYENGYSILEEGEYEE